MVSWPLAIISQAKKGRVSEWHLIYNFRAILKLLILVLTDIYVTKTFGKYCILCLRVSDQTRLGVCQKGRTLILACSSEGTKY